MLQELIILKHFLRILNLCIPIFMASLVYVKFLLVSLFIAHDYHKPQDRFLFSTRERLLPNKYCNVYLIIHDNLVVF